MLRTVFQHLGKRDGRRYIKNIKAGSHFRFCHLDPSQSDPVVADRCKAFSMGRKLFGDFFLVWGIFFGFPVLTIFHAICSILELETAISTVCATVLSSNLSFSIVFSTVFATVCSMFCPFSMLFAAFLSWNLHFHRMCNILQLHSSQYLQDFGAEG